MWILKFFSVFFFSVFSLRFQLGNSFVNTKVVFSVIFPFYVFVLELKKKLRIKWSISLLNPLEKCKKQPRKGGDPEDPDIKIIMYVYTPLNKVFWFQGSNQIFGGWNCFSIPFLFEPSLKPFLKPSRLFELEAVHSKLQILPEKFWSWKNNKAQMVDFLTKPSRNMQKTIVQRGWPWRPMTSK